MEDFEIVQNERDRKVVEIVHYFLLFIVTFRQYYQKYKQGPLNFSDLARFVDDRGESLLYMLKESCHNLFRHSSSNISEKERIFDLTIGSIFHLAMKMREDLYQLEFYGPKYMSLSAKTPSSHGEEDLINQFKEIHSRAEGSLKEGMEEISLLSRDIFRQFKGLLHQNRGNGLLIRFLLEENELLKEAMGEGALNEIFHILFGQDISQAYRLAGESYFQSAFYSKAIQAFSTAREMNPQDESIQFMLHLSQGMEQFYSFAPLQALNSFEKCLSYAGKVEFLETYRTMIRKVCQKIQEEFPGRRKNDQHRNLIKKAALLQSQMGNPLPSRVEAQPEPDTPSSLKT